MNGLSKGSGSDLSKPVKNARGSSKVGDGGVQTITLHNSENFIRTRNLIKPKGANRNDASPEL